ncbi:uncharacterized protein LOC130799257 [Amaranthus tricolor]|uniref:uncharacterized protein LOC130799257 n=1 Tax=Amaranthus tricolor TaxID=29722 RepID=UPI0025901474|nr:uncharacterized protein LOC130799257 [Amaranthus tricolor]
MRFGRKGKISPWFIGPYKILERIGEVAYRLALPASINRYEETPVQILDRKTRDTRGGSVTPVKVLWSNHVTQEAMWEAEDAMRRDYPWLFAQIWSKRDADIK